MSKLTEDKKRFTNRVSGTITQGSLRSQDLLPAFMNIIGMFVDNGGKLDPSHKWDTLVKEVKEKLMVKVDDKFYFVSEDSKEWDSEFTSFVINGDLWTILNDIAPAGYEFGTLEGDGAEFGFWTYCAKENSYDENSCLTCPHKDTVLCPENI